jgi:hypothetical protein
LKFGDFCENKLFYFLLEVVAAKMVEIKIHLSNQTKIDLIFTVNDEKITVGSGFSRTVPVAECKYLAVTGDGLEGDFWIYEIKEDISLKCSLYGRELKLHL